MTSLVLVHPLQQPYSVEIAPDALLALKQLPNGVSLQVRQRLKEIAEVAGSLASAVADGFSSTLLLEIAGYTISYVVSDARRTLTVLSLVPTSTLAS
jgi:mRNA-degrading endonuclease RelE of RelBE toxin-antitoxin system